MGDDLPERAPADTQGRDIMLIISDFRSTLPVSLLGYTPLPTVRDRHAGWRHDIANHASERNPLVPRPRARLA